MGLVSLRSNLAINGTPERYDPQGKLGNLPPGASQLDFDGALPAPADNFTNDHANGFTIQNPVGVTQFVDDGQTSILGPSAGTPDKYDTTGKLGTLPPGSSQLNFDGALPAPVDFITNNNARGFTIGMNTTQFKRKGQTSRLGFAAPLPAPVDFFLNNNARGFTLNMNSSRFRNQGQTSQLGFPGPIPGAQDFFLNTHANGFTIRMNSTQFKNDGQTSQFGFPSAMPAPVDFFLNTHANGFVLRAPSLITQFVDPGNSSIFGFAGPLPAPVDFFTNTHANGFTLQAPTLITQFTDPGNSSIFGWPGPSSGAPEVDFFVNKNRFGFKKFQQVGVSYFINDGQTSIHGFRGPLPSPVDYFTNDHAAGFTLRAPVGVTQFAFDGQTSQFGFQGKLPPPVDFFLNTNAKGFTIQNPYGVTQFLGVGGAGTTYINPSGLNALRTVDYFQDPFSGAVGFKDRLAPYESGYIGISADSTKYQYPNTVKGGRLLNVRLGQGAGTAKLENQLGAGSKMGNTGFYAENRYGEAVRNADNGSLLASWALRRRSPSPLELQYSKFKLRNEAFNPTFIGQPLILRGLQNPDVLNPQRWGLDALGQQEGRTAANNIVAAIDGGFIRGGASTALERSAIDTARIAKFLASPKGLVWSITQVGLGKSNIRPHGSMPYEELALVTQNPQALLNNTQTHSGLASLLSVPGSAFGLHFTRHGIPFLNEVASYEYVLKNFTRAETEQPSKLYHKHLRLKDELLNIERPDAVAIGSPISNLSYDGGPQSVYGLGNTTVKRATDTLEGWKRFKPKAYPDPSQLKALPQPPKRALSNQITLDMEPNRARIRYLEKRTAVVAENRAKVKEIDDFNAKIRKADLEFSPWYSFNRRYYSVLNQNKTTQGTIQQDKQSASGQSPTIDDLKEPGAPLGLSLYLTKAAGELDENLKDTGNNNIFYTPGDGRLGDINNPITVNNEPRAADTEFNRRSELRHASLPYHEIRRISKERRSFRNTTINDFRSSLKEIGNSPVARSETFSTDPTIANYARNNLRDRYGFGDHGSTNPDIDRSNPYSIKNNRNTEVGNIDGTIAMLNDKTNKGKRFALATNKNFRGDRINAIDYVPPSDSKNKTQLYPDNVKDFIKFYFSGINMYDTFSDDAIVFRSTIKGLSDSFSPGWNTVSIMGRPDGPAIYSSFERNISFNFTVAATAREELVPMWRKLNYLASYTMPIYGDGRPGGALCRLTLGDMFNNTPGYFTGLTITVNDEASWDLADDLVGESDPVVTLNRSNTARVTKNKYAKQLPNLIDVDVQFKIIHDWRPEKGGRVYSLYSSNFSTPESDGNWLWDSSL